MYATGVYSGLAMIRTQIYLTSNQREQLAAIAAASGKRQSEVIREAVDLFIGRHNRDQRQAVLRKAAGIWEDRADLPSLHVLRKTWDRD